MQDIADIPNLPSRDERLEAATVDCYNEEEERMGIEVYLEEALQFPFAATWRDTDEPGHTERVTVLGKDPYEGHRGVLLTVRLEGSGRQRRVPADQLWPDEKTGPNPIVLDDYRAWVDE